MHAAESLRVAVAPLEVVEQRPDLLAAQVDAALHRAVGGREVAAQVVDALDVPHAAVDDLVGEGSAVLGHHERQPRELLVEVDEEVLEAAQATFVDRFVHSLPDGYDTLVDEEGSNLSAGERQLITIARAFLTNPALLILDEATSSVDTRTELLLQHAMAALRTDRTSFVIAHRLSTIRDADLILVMEDGSIVEQGTHDELVAAGGAYSRLYQSQYAASAVVS